MIFNLCFFFVFRFLYFVFCFPFLLSQTIFVYANCRHAPAVLVWLLLLLLAHTFVAVINYGCQHWVAFSHALSAFQINSPPSKPAQRPLSCQAKGHPFEVGRPTEKASRVMSVATSISQVAMELDVHTIIHTTHIHT